MWSVDAEPEALIARVRQPTMPPTLPERAHRHGSTVGRDAGSQPA